MQYKPVRTHTVQEQQRTSRDEFPGYSLCVRTGELYSKCVYKTCFIEQLYSKCVYKTCFIEQYITVVELAAMYITLSYVVTLSEKATLFLSKLIVQCHLMYIKFVLEYV